MKVGIFFLEDGENDMDGGDTDPNGGRFVQPAEIIALPGKIIVWNKYVGFSLQMMNYFVA